VGDVRVEPALSARSQHAEGPLWDAATARLWWVDIMGRRVHRSDPVVDEDRSWATPGQPGGVVLDPAGRPIVATPEGLARLDTSTGAMLLLVPIEQELVETRGNDAKVDPNGRVWVGTMAYDKRPQHAGLYRVEHARAVPAVEALTISNGPAFDAQARRLYLADTALHVIDVFDLDLETGHLTGRRRFVDLSDTGWWPDGMTVDDDGMLWVALGRAGAVHRYRPNGDLDGRVELPTSNPTSVAFGGQDADQLFITTSWFDLEPDERAVQPLAGSVFGCRPGVRGPASPRAAGLDRAAASDAAAQGFDHSME
jgi:sugar lactone lactonase YvrE